MVLIISSAHIYIHIYTLPRFVHIYTHYYFVLFLVLKINGCDFIFAFCHVYLLFFVYHVYIVVGSWTLSPPISHFAFPLLRGSCFTKPLPTAQHNLRACLVRIPVEPGSYLGVWLIWDRLSTHTLLCLVACTCLAWLRRDAVWLRVKKHVAWNKNIIILWLTFFILCKYTLNVLVLDNYVLNIFKTY
jgi:hypothetical protein